MIKNNLKLIREQARISQKELSDKTGIQQPQMSRYESGQIPEYSNMALIASVLGVTIQDIWPVESVEA